MPSRQKHISMDVHKTSGANFKGAKFKPCDSKTLCKEYSYLYFLHRALLCPIAILIVKGKRLWAKL